MKLIKTLSALTLLPCLTMAQENPATPTPPAPAPQALSKDTKEAMLEKLFASLKPGQLAPILAEAKKMGIPQQTLLEARFIHHIDTLNNKGIAAMAPDLVKHKDIFDPSISEVFAIKQDWLAIIHYSQALAALQADNKALFKKHITEAFWLSPAQAQAFAPHIEKLHMQEAMAKVIINRKLALKSQDNKEMPTLGSLMQDKKALVLHFWSPISQEVQHHLPDFALTSQELAKNNIAVCSILLGNNAETLKDTEAIRKKFSSGKDSDAKCSWLLDDTKESLATQFRISNIPTMVVISPEGKVLHNGHPSADAFWNSITKIAPNFKRPNNHNHAHDHNHANEKQPGSAEKK